MFVSSPCLKLKKSKSSVRICRCKKLSNSFRACSASIHKPVPPVESKEVPSAPSQSGAQALNRDVEAEAREILEWQSLSRYISRLARTDGGRLLLENGMGDDGGGLEIGYNRARCEELLEETREMVRLAHELSREVPLAGASEVSGVARDAAKGRLLSGRELRKIASTLLAARKTRRVFESANSDTEGGFPRLLSHASAARTWPDIEASILEKVDEFGDVTDIADPQLANARSERREVIDAIRSKLRDLMTTHSEAIQDRNITMRYDRMCIPVKMTRKAVFRGGTVHDVSATGGTAYIEPASVRKLNDRIRACAAKEKSRIQVVLRALSETVATIEEDIVQLCEGLSAIDAAAARAEASAAIGGVDVRFMEMEDESKIQLRGLRHPLLLWQAKENAEARKESDWMDKVIPSDYYLPALVRCAILSGSNTGGKTLALKTLGLTSLMAKSGLFVPAAKLEAGFISLPYFDKVLLDAGDDQSIVQSLSTFSGHMERIKRILNATSPRSLVLLDEVGSGTDPQEGAALGAAILRSLAVEKRAALTMATTHHGELKTLKYTDGIGELFENVCVEFDDIAMKPTYRLLWGIPGRSNALAIAQRLGLASEIIDDARSMLSSGSDVSSVDFEEMIRNLEQQRREADEAAQSAQLARSEAASLRDEAEVRLRELAESEETLRSGQKAAVDAEIARAKRSIAGVIRDLQQGGSAQAAAAATGKLGRIEQSMRKERPGVKNYIQDDVGEESKEISVGARVRVARLGSGFSEVVEVGCNDLMVAVGRMRAKVKRKEVLEVIPKKREIKKQRPRQSKTAASKTKKMVSIRTSANTVNVIGERTDAAEPLIEQAMSRAMSVGVLWIVHGHGTGRLRAGIREFLRGHDLVESYRNGDDSEGGTAVTVVELKSLF